MSDGKGLPIWIEVPNVPVNSAELRRYVGLKCRDYEPECCVCQSWKQWETTGTINVLIERRELIT